MVDREAMKPMDGRQPNPFETKLTTMTMEAEKKMKVDLLFPRGWGRDSQTDAAFHCRLLVEW
jgi:hypothetical protein